MATRWRYAATSALFVLTLALPTTAGADDRWRSRGHRGHANVSQVPFDNGFREGFEHGARDAREGRDFNYQHHEEFREADEGYRREYGDRDSYRRLFREGYATGYTEAYNGAFGGGRRSGGGQDPRAYPRTSPNRGGYPDRNPYPSWGRYPRNGGSGAFDRAFENGFADGYQKGLEDGRDSDRVDPVRHSRYRSGDRGYHGSYGSREEYKLNYREGFRGGYDQGYRDGRRYGGRGNRDVFRRGGWWPF